MQCPFCQTENREDRERCYACDKDISMLRLITNKARHHYNVALEHAERGRTVEAIDELKNAIDLDRRFVPAHVVLGTLYAKQQQFQEARDAWDAALAINPEFSKAHRYLDKLGPAETALPFLANVQRIGWVVAGALLILALLLVFSWRDPAGAKPLRNADAALRAGNYGTALSNAEQARQQARSGSVVDTAAGALESAVRLDFDQQIRQIQDLKYREDYPRVMEALAALESRHPDLATSTVLTNVRQDVAHYYRQQIQELLRRFETGEVAFAEIAKRLREFERLYPQMPDNAALRESLDRARDTEIRRRVSGLVAAFKQDGDVSAATDQLRRLAEEFPHSQAAQRARAEAVDDLFTLLFDAFQERLDAEEFAVGRDILDRISDVAIETSDVVNVRGPLELAGRMHADAMRAAELRDAEALVREGRDLTTAYAALDLLDIDDSLTQAEREALNGLYEEMERRDLQQRMTKLRSRRVALLAGRIAAEETTTVLAEAESVADLITDPRDRAEAHLLAAAAAAATGDRELATQHIAQARAAAEGVVTRSISDTIMRLANRNAGVSVEPARNATSPLPSGGTTQRPRR